MSTEVGAQTLDRIDPNGVLATTFLGTEYRSPLVVASGTLVERFDQIEPFLDAGAGAVIPRTTRFLMERTVHPSPHLYQEGVRSHATMLNAEWTGADIDYWRPYLDRVKSYGNVVMGVSGRDIDGCVKVCRVLDEYELPFFEINISCGVSNGVHGYITRNEEHIKEVCSKIKDAGVTTPIALKLGHSDGIVHLADVAKDAGADAIVATNTYGPVFDFTIGGEGEPHSVMGVVGAKGGLSGDALFHIALTDVADISREVGLPVVASGGVMTAERAMKMIYAGAGLVELYTVLHDQGVKAPNVLTDFTQKVVAFADKHQISSVNSVRGKALQLLSQKTNLVPQIPTVDDALCTGCDRCVPLCLPRAIDITEQPPTAAGKQRHTVVINENCVGCGHCVEQCPVEGALTLPQQITL